MDRDHNSLFYPSCISIRVRGSRDWATLLWTVVLCSGGLFFFLTGLLAYLGQTKLTYIPQGVFLIFYGTLALMLSLFFLGTMLWDVGSGLCTMDKNRNLCRVIRLNFPGDYRLFEMTFPISKIKGVGLELRSGLFPKRILGLTVGAARQLPLNYNQELIKISTLETVALALAKWLGVGLEWREKSG